MIRTRFGAIASNHANEPEARSPTHNKILNQTRSLPSPLGASVASSRLTPRRRLVPSGANRGTLAETL
jgi:hypothetical protein